MLVNVLLEKVTALSASEGCGIMVCIILGKVKFNNNYSFKNICNLLLTHGHRKFTAENIKGWGLT